MKLKKTIKAEKESEIYHQISDNIYINSDYKKTKIMLFVISEISRGEKNNIVKYRYGGINERTNNLRPGKLECRNIEEDMYRYILNITGIQKNTVVIDYTDLGGEKKLKRTMDFLARFKYNIFIKENKFVK